MGQKFVLAGLLAETGGGGDVGSTQVVVLAAQVAGTGLVCEAWTAPRPTLYSATVATSRQWFHLHAAVPSSFTSVCMEFLRAGKKSIAIRVGVWRCRVLLCAARPDVTEGVTASLCDEMRFRRL